MKQVKQSAWLHLLLAVFLMYMAFPFIASHPVGIAHLFWFSWLTFFVLFIGANLAIIFKINHQRNEATLTDNVRKQMKN